MAGGAGAYSRNDDRPGYREVRARHERLYENAETRRCGDRTRLCGAVMSTTTQTAPYGERAVTLTRVFNAPRELVWRAWTDPKHMAQWFGPHGFTSSVPELTVR